MRHKVTVLYKSGASVNVKCDKFTVNHLGSDITSVSWVNAKPRPLHIGISDIAAVWVRR